MDPIFLAELAANGALTGLLYSLFAIGLVLIYKASSVPNLAQGGLTMAGAYVVLALARDAGLPLWAAIPLAGVAMFGLGIGIERVALRRLAGRPIVMILMMTLGIDIFLRAITLAIWGGHLALGRTRPQLRPSLPRRHPDQPHPLGRRGRGGRIVQRLRHFLPQPPGHPPARYSGRLHGLLVRGHFGRARRGPVLGARFHRRGGGRRHMG